MDEAAILRSRFGSRVKARLESKGLEAGDLAALSKRPIRRIEKILDGNHAGLTIREMEVVASVLDTSLYDLLAPDPAFTSNDSVSRAS